jgi:hypothetical protein
MYFFHKDGSNLKMLKISDKPGHFKVRYAAQCNDKYNLFFLMIIINLSHDIAFYLSEQHSIPYSVSRCSAAAAGWT